VYRVVPVVVVVAHLAGPGLGPQLEQVVAVVVAAVG
jgi:hypothetical protein